MSWGPAIAIGAASLFALLLLFFQIGSLTKGAHPAEVAVAQSYPSYTSVVKKPIDAPYYIIRNTVRKVRPKSGIIITRGISALIGFISVGLFYALVSLWYRPRVAILGTLLYVSSNWLLRNDRIGLPDIKQSLVLLLIFLPAWLKRTQHKQMAILGAVMAGIYLLHIPGMIWFVLLGMIWRAQSLGSELKKASKPFVIGLLMFFVITISPLVYSIINQPSVLLQLAGIPNNLLLLDVMRNFVAIPTHLFAQGDGNSLLGVGRMPILDVFTTFMVLLGAIATWQSRKLDRSKIVLGILAVGFILSCLGGSMLMTILIPPIYLLATAGIGYMLNEWLCVFPKNPLARGIATVLITVAVIIASAFHITNYFIAWPNTPQTRVTFSQRY